MVILKCSFLLFKINFDDDDDENNKNNFFIFVLEPPVTIVGNSYDSDYQELVVGNDLILACELSRANAPVQWYCNDRLLTNDSRARIETFGILRKLTISSIQLSDSGKYVCDAVDDKMISMVRVQGINPECLFYRVYGRWK